MTTNSNLGARLRTYRNQWGFSQEHLATLLHVKREQISYYETGERAIPLHQLERITDVFGVELSDFLNQDPDTAAVSVEVAFRADELPKEDTPAIADFRRIVKNYLKLVKIND